jgi:putative NADPH-quinone reductase
MRILIVFAHPDRSSYVGSVLDALVAGLQARAHEVEVADLYAQGFSPVLGAAAWKAHRQDRRAEGEVDAEVAALRACEGLVFVHPTWWYGLPAMLKGWLDRVWQPGVAFVLQDGVFQLHQLSNVTRFAAITTCGSPGWFIRGVAGDPVRRQLRGLSLQFARRVKTGYEAVYDVDKRTETDLAKAREKAVARVVRLMG